MGRCSKIDEVILRYMMSGKKSRVFEEGRGNDQLEKHIGGAEREGK